MGVTVCTHQMGIVPTRKLPLARSVFTNSMPATVRKSVMVVAAVPLKSAAKTFHLGGRIVGSADMASSRLSRAASAPPSIPMSSVQCWTKVVAPGMPEAKALRRNASSNGSTISATRMEQSRRFSPWRSHRRRPVVGAASVVVGSEFMRCRERGRLPPQQFSSRRLRVNAPGADVGVRAPFAFASAAHFPAFARYSFTSFDTSSNISAGMSLPRIFG